MTESISNEIKDARKLANTEVSSELVGLDRRNAVFLLTLVNIAEKALGERENIKGYLGYAKTPEGQKELLSLAGDFDTAIQKLNSTAGKEIESKHSNTKVVRQETRLGQEVIPQLLSENFLPHAAILQFEKGEETLSKQNSYMKNSESARTNEALATQIKEEGNWSEIHLNAIDSKHFLATLLVDLYPGMVRRYLQASGRHEDLDTDELVRAICEQMDQKSKRFKLIKDQGWFTEEEFSKEFVDSIEKNS